MPSIILAPPALPLTTGFAGTRRPFVWHRARCGSAGRRAAGWGRRVATPRVGRRWSRVGRRAPVVGSRSVVGHGTAVFARRPSTSESRIPAAERVSRTGPRHRSRSADRRRRAGARRRDVGPRRRLFTTAAIREARIPIPEARIPNPAEVPPAHAVACADPWDCDRAAARSGTGHPRLRRPPEINRRPAVRVPSAIWRRVAGSSAVERLTPDDRAARAASIVTGIIPAVPARLEGSARHCPVVPSTTRSNRQREDRTAIPAERTPAHVIVGKRPRHPRRAPGAARNPEPGIARVPPAAVVMRRPGPCLRTDPCPAVRTDRRPRAV